MEFDAAFAKVLGHEGDFSNHPADPGGKTRFGVTEEVARDNGYTGDMRVFPVEQAKQIYRDKYWSAVKAEQLPPYLRFVVFDAAVNSGPRQAILWLQKALGVAEDGVIGQQTLSAAAASVGADKRLLGHRLRFMTNLNTWPAFGRGWARRIADQLEQA